MDKCTANPLHCYNSDYKDYCYENYGTVLGMTDYSQDQFIEYWSASVADAFDLDPTEVAAIYTSGTSNSDTRTMWKYASSR